MDVIEVDSNAYQDSNYHPSDSELSTESVTSSIYAYRYENGRRYHAYHEGKYLLPNDEAEQDRLDIVHHTGLLLMNNKLHLSPIGQNPQRILDIGTGTGIWAIDTAEFYPSAQVIGTDLSPIQPSWVPPNAQFHIDDAECEWTWPAGHFDFIHIRHMSGSIKDWPALIGKAVKHLKPGGWLESNEWDFWLFSDDGTLTEDMYLSKFYKLVHKAAAKSGRIFPAPDDMRRNIEAAGLENIQREMLKMPLGTWPADKTQKEVGAYSLLIAQTGFEAFGMALLTRELGLSVDDVHKVVNGAKKEANNRRIHTYTKQYIWSGQKPNAK